jgi:predicted unusual protein kinase regulating ubiquinone biosynthesis (AarF/ABC1/UbiB family)
MKTILRVRYWRIVLFFARVTASIIFWDILLAAHWAAALGQKIPSAAAAKYCDAFPCLAIRLGGVMIKVGQFLSARLDVLPPEITDELSGLQDEVPPVDYESIRLQTELELGSAIEKVFLTFEKEPVAAASLGQVHRASCFQTKLKRLALKMSWSKFSVRTLSRSWKWTCLQFAWWVAGSNVTNPSVTGRMSLPLWRNSPPS